MLHIGVIVVVRFEKTSSVSHEFVNLLSDQILMT